MAKKDEAVALTPPSSDPIVLFGTNLVWSTGGSSPLARFVEPKLRPKPRASRAVTEAARGLRSGWAHSLRSACQPGYRCERLPSEQDPTRSELPGPPPEQPILW